MWTHFWDMNSGGGRKEPQNHIFIEAAEDEAKRIFYARFGHNPERVTCTCCGEDYSISTGESLEQLTAYHRNCEYAYFRPDGSECPEAEAWRPGRGTTAGYVGKYVERQCQRNMDIRRQYNTASSNPWGLLISLDDYLKREDVLVIRADEIKPEWRAADVPSQGYVWVD